MREAVVVETRESAAMLEAIARRATDAGVFGSVQVRGTRLIAPARCPAAPAEYRIEVEGIDAFVGVFTADRWLSHSVEADLLNTGDDLEELLEEELIELGGSAPAPTIDHFRNDEKLFAFRSKAGVGAGDPRAAEVLGTLLLAYEACFRHLGDMHKDTDDE
ncbi:MAG: hypothetical protein JSS51_01660 [Planctomycetes bacterium]|nr:hypothetical protein [Planctomycetota bacterium]